MLFLGPGDGASFSSQNSVAVPVPAGAPSILTVFVDTVPRSNPSLTGTGWNITECVNSNCAGHPFCQITANSASCSVSSPLSYNDGDTLSLQVVPLIGGGNPATPDATWAANYTIANP